jgi:phosphoglycerate kinase
MAGLRTLDDVEPSGRTVLVRVDFNVPIRDGRVTDTARIDRAARSIAELVQRQAKVVLLSHFGRPKGQPSPDTSLAPILGPLRAALGDVILRYAGDSIGDAARQTIAALRPGEVALLENLRWNPGEEAGEPAFADALAAHGDLFVSDAFSVAHRAHASVVGLAERLPAVAGRLMQAELEHLEAALEHPTRPLMAVVGGAKVSTKLDVLRNMLGKVDAMAIGGAMANTFLHARGHDVGASMCEREMTDTANDILAQATAGGCEIVLPRDVVVADRLAGDAASDVVGVDAVAGDKMILDLGPETAVQLSHRLEQCASLVWNGPLGAFETPPFDAATVQVARKAAELTRAGRLMSVAGGGDTGAALAHAGALAGFSYVSLAGGAFLEWLEGKELPGVRVLRA